MFFDPFATVIATLPLATYLLLIGGIRLTGRPFVTTGTRDAAAVALAVSGLVMVGPANLFLPTTAAAQLGWWVWVLLMLLYLLSVCLLLFSFPPRLVIYGLKATDVLAMLETATQQIDNTAASVPERMQVTLQAHGVHLRVEPLGWTHAVAVEAFEKNLHPQFWNHLLRSFREQTRSMHSRSSRGAGALFVAGCSLMALAIYQILGNPSETLAGFRQWLNL